MLRRLSSIASNQSGIALFMVIAAMTVLSILVTEFTYIAQVSQRVAYSGLDQVKAHYLAKTGFKLSLLRLKAYQHVKGLAEGQGVPTQIIEQIWQFPFVYPIPTELPGLTGAEKDMIEKFQKDSNLDGNFTAVIQPESGKFNLNLLLAPFVPKEKPEEKKKANSQSPRANPTPSPTPTATPQAQQAFDPEAARTALREFLAGILEAKFQEDPDFAADYRDLRVEDLSNAIAAWADRTFEAPGGGREVIPPKGAPFYSLNELHMVEGMDDRLFDLIAPNLTVSPTPGINVNTMEMPTLQALVPNISEEEAKAFFKFRDDPEENNRFKSPDDFFKYMGDTFSSYRSPEAMQEFRTQLKQRNIVIVTDEQSFKITVQAQVNNATRLLEAWVSMVDDQKKTQDANAPGSPPGMQQQPFIQGGDLTSQAQETGLKVTFMRIL